MPITINQQPARPSSRSVFASIISEIRRHYFNLFPEHSWHSYRESEHADEKRVCMVCGQLEYWDCGGAAAPMWMKLEKGRAKSHYRVRAMRVGPALLVTAVEHEAVEAGQ